MTGATPPQGYQSIASADQVKRAAHFASEKKEADAARTTTFQAKQAEMEARKEASQRKQSAVTKILIILPDGVSLAKSFRSDASLEEVRQFAARIARGAYGNFSLVTASSMREFTKEEYGKKLLDLKLTPSATVLMLPERMLATSLIQSFSGPIWKLIDAITYLLTVVCQFIKSFLFTSPPPPTLHRTESCQQEHSYSSVSNPSRTSSSQILRQILKKRTRELQEYKMYGLKYQDDGEDNNNT